MLQGVYCEGCKRDGPIKEDEHTHKGCMCNGQKIVNMLGWEKCPPYPEERIYPKNKINEKGFILCKWCGLPIDIPGYLVVCPVCGAHFPGPRPRFPIDYECENCE